MRVLLNKGDVMQALVAFMSEVFRKTAKLGRPAIKRIRTYRAVNNRRRSQATFIAVTGSSAKSTTTALISHILSGAAPVQTRLVSNGYAAYIRSLQARPRDGYFVGEIGAEGPDTLLPILQLMQPSVGVVTLVALEHKSAFGTVDAVATEKQRLVEALPAHGLAVLNYDDARVSGMVQHTRARAVTFGQAGGDYVASEVRCPAPGKLRLTIAHQTEVFDVATRLTGTHNWVAVAAAFACIHQLGVPPAMIIQRFENFVPLFGRCSLHRVENGPTFIVDTVKAPNHSLQLALDLVSGTSAPRKRVVIGQISDQADSNCTYRKAYAAARLVADQVIFVGEHSHRSRATAEDVAAGRFVRFENVHQAAAFLKESAIAGEIILLKSSPKLHLERLMLNFFGPVHCWKDICGKNTTCVKLYDGGCGLYEIPFDRHLSKKGSSATI